MKKPFLLVHAGLFLLIASGCHSAKEGVLRTDARTARQLIPTLRQAYAAFNRGDMNAAVQSLDADIDWTEPAEFPGGGHYRGREAVKGYLAQSRAGMAEGTSEPEQFITVGNRIVTYVHAHIRPKGSDQWQDVRLADVYTVSDGRLVAMRAFANREDALRWAMEAAE